MNFTAARQSADIIRTEGQRLDPKWLAARQQQFEALARLEEKYGGRKLRIDSAHRMTNPPHLRAFQLQAYTDWLTKQFATPESQPVSAPGSPAQPASRGWHRRTANIQPKPIVPNSSLNFASPDILATATPIATEPEVARARLASQPAPVKSPANRAGSSRERSQRIDLAHAKAAPTQNFKPAPGFDLPTTTVAWEVDDFIWPKVLDESKFWKTAAAQHMVDAIAKSLTSDEQRLAVVGSGRGKGTTTISMIVARILAERGNRVLLVDADVAKPDLTQRLGLPPNFSWMNVINENRNCSDAIVRSIKTGICVMPASKLTARVAWPSQIHDCLANILENVRQHFEMVIIDVGPSSQLIRELSRPNLLVDAAILVHNVRVPDNSVFVRNQNELYSFGIRKLVVAENFAAGRAA